MCDAFVTEGLSFRRNNLIFIFTTDARREARKAFLAFASEDVKAPYPANEPDEEPESFMAQPVDNDTQSSKSLPVRSSCYQYYYSCFSFYDPLPNYERCL